jgi:tetratricopeptide (TPR) repeat protein
MAACALVGAAGPAHAQRTRSQAEAEIERLLEDARSYYDNLELDLSDRSLDRAIRLGERFDVKTRALAEVYLQRGVLVHVRDKNEQEAIDDFRQALRIDPSVRLDPLISTPSLDKLFEQALQEVGGGRPAGGDNGGGGGGGDLIHQPIRQAKSGQKLTVGIEVGPDLNQEIYRVYLYFRSARSESVQRLEMQPDGQRGFSADIPGRFVAGSSLSYYIVAEDRMARAVGGVASAREPIVVPVTGDALAGIDEMPTGSSLNGGDEEDDEGGGSGRHYVTLTIDVGTGAGFITDRATPQNQKRANIRPGAALSPFHTMAELDFWATDRFALGAYARIQIIEFAHLEGGCLKFKVLESGAHSLILRAGGGVGRVRHLVELDGFLDTTLEGPYHYTLGGTYAYAFTKSLSLAVTPAFIHLIGDSPAFHFDLNTGLRIAF